MNSHYVIGFDFGTESARALLVNVGDGSIAAQAVTPYAHGVIERALPGGGRSLPPDHAHQHPQDWLDSATSACRQALRQAAISPDEVIGIGIDFTSCTMLPALADGRPLCLTDRFTNEPMAWPKLWKHHGAKAETDRLNEIARQRREPWLGRYGGAIGLEWFFPKILETLNSAPGVYAATDVWLEAGDWFVWQLIDGPFPRCSPAHLTRSTCQAGYKACWHKQEGYPSADYFAAVHPAMRDVVSAKMPGALRAPGSRAGGLSDACAALLGLRAGTPVSTATIDAHAGVAGAGASAPGTMVLVLGTSACHMVNSLTEHVVPGVAGIVQDGILPGYFGYETGQAAVGDALDWVSRSFAISHEELNHKAMDVLPGSGGVLAIDWLNGCRTPLMDPHVSGALIGLTLSTRPEQIYRAMIEATAFGLRWICQTLRDGGVPIHSFVAAGGLSVKSPLLMQIYSDVLGEDIRLAASEQSVALGAAIFGAIAAGPQASGHRTIDQAIAAMAPIRSDLIYRPNPISHSRYQVLDNLYRHLTDTTCLLCESMRKLRSLNLQ